MPRITPAQGFYVYTLARPDLRVFYVGKGKGGRIFRHEEEAKRGCACHKCCVIRKVWKSGGAVQRSVVFMAEDEQSAINYEIALIAEYGRENLTNKTNGGDGISGFRQSEESIRRRVAKNTGKKRTLEQRARMSLGMKGRPGNPHTPEIIARIKAKQIGVKKKPHTEEMRRAKSERQKGIKRQTPVSEETRRRLSESHTGKKLGAYAPERVQKALAGRSGIRRPDSEETRRKKSEAQKQRYERQRNTKEESGASVL